VVEASSSDPAYTQAYLDSPVMNQYAAVQEEIFERCFR